MSADLAGTSFLREPMAMIGQTISHYRILEKLPTAFLRNRTPSGQVGEDGMGVAHKARDSKLDCLVGLKFFLPSLSLAEIAKERTMVSRLGIVIALLFTCLATLSSQNTFWEQTSGPFLPRVVGELTSHPSGDIFCLSKDASDYYLLRSSDNGISWVEVNRAFFDPVKSSGTTLKFDALYVHKDGSVYGSMVFQGVFRSKDKGATWEKFFDKLGSISSYSLLGVNSVGYIFAQPYQPSDGNIYCSTDNGTSWVRRENGLYAGYWNFKFIIDDDDNLYLQNLANRVYRSTNNGLQWSELLPYEVQFLRIHSRGVYFAGVSNISGNTARVIRSTDQGATWNDVLPPTLSSRVKVLDLKKGLGGQLYLYTKDTLLVSKDLGNSWRVADIKFAGEEISDVTTNASGQLLVGTNAGWIYFSADDGASWTKRGARFEKYVSVYRIAVDSKDRLFAGATTYGMFLSTNNGSTWTAAGGSGLASPNIFSIAINGFDHVYAGTTYGLFVSTDNGGNWVKVNCQFSTKIIYGIAFSSKGNIFVNAQQELFRSTNGGATWDSKALSKSYNTMYFHLDASDNIFAYIDDTLRFSADNGETWSKRNAGLPSTTRITSIEASPQGTLFVGMANGGLYYSTNQGATWNSRSTGLRGPANEVADIVCLPNGEMYLNVGRAHNYVGFFYEDYGVFVSTNGGYAWRFLNTSATASAEEASCIVGTKDNRILAGLSHGVMIGSARSSSVEAGALSILNQYILEQNYPNPFNPSTTISYSFPKSATVSLRIFNALGQEVAQLVNERKEAGYYHVTWNATVPSGIYFYRLQARQIDGGQAGDASTGSARGFVETKKMILIR